MDQCVGAVVRTQFLERLNLRSYVGVEESLPVHV